MVVIFFGMCKIITTIWVVQMCCFNYECQIFSVTGKLWIVGMQVPWGVLAALGQFCHHQINVHACDTFYAGRKACCLCSLHPLVWLSCHFVLLVLLMFMKLTQAENVWNWPVHLTDTPLYGRLFILLGLVFVFSSWLVSTITGVVELSRCADLVHKINTFVRSSTIA